MTGAFRFPDGDAGAFRVASVADLFSLLGWEVIIAGWESAGRPSYRHTQYECFPQSEFRETELDPVRRLESFVLQGRHTLSWLAKQNRFDVIVAYNPPALFASRLHRRCRAWDTVAVVDSTEWFDGSHLPGGRLGPAAVENWCRMRVVYPRFDHIICISTFLEGHFVGRNVLRLPPLQGRTPGPVPPRPPLSEGIRLAYAGQPGKKDRLVSVLRALPAVSDAVGVPVRLSIAGVERAELDGILANERSDASRIAESIECLGRVSREAVSELYRASHFSVLFRLNRRYALAGFPTKAIESWSHGCPIVCNPVGDIARIATDGMDVLFVEERELATKLPRILKAIMSDDRYPRMVAACRAKVADRFTLSAHIASFERFVGNMDVPERSPMSTTP